MILKNNNLWKNLKNNSLFLKMLSLVILIITLFLPHLLSKSLPKQTTSSVYPQFEDIILSLNTALNPPAPSTLPEDQAAFFYYSLSDIEKIYLQLNPHPSLLILYTEPSYASHSKLNYSLSQKVVSESQQKTEASEIRLPNDIHANEAKLTPAPTFKNTASKSSLPVKENWTIIKTLEKDSLASLFKRVGLSNQTLHRLLKEVSQVKTLSIRPNQEIKFLIKNKTLDKLILPWNNTQTLLVYKVGETYKTQVITRKTTIKQHIISSTVQHSLYNTASKKNIPLSLIHQMSQIFYSEINFKRDVKSGDHIQIIYEAIYDQDKLISVGDIVAVLYKNQNKLFQAFRYTNKAGRSEYYNAEGKSLKKAFDRYPVQYTHISSPFSFNRYHPILGYKKPHKGIDLAAPMGTPIRATGDGHISTIARHNGYGNMIKIKHNPSHTSVYGHLLRFQKGLSKGSFVKRGQVIGYVGQSGLATGPHCHYEFRVHNQPKNPTTISLPQGNHIPSKELATFKNNMLLMLAELKQYENTKRYA